MNIGILGGGQLARMLALAGLPYGLNFTFLTNKQENCVHALGEVIYSPEFSEDDLQFFADKVDVITYETENIPVPVAKSLEKRKPIYPSIKALEVAQNRLREYELFQSLDIPAPKTTALSAFSSWHDVDKQMPFVMKRIEGGFDGRGQQIFNDNCPFNTSIFDEERELSLIQEMIDFDFEVSCITVHQGQQTVHYPLCMNKHMQGILKYSIPMQESNLLGKAVVYNNAIATTLNYCGTLVVEYFVKGEQLIANEIAPRVHNSGHWTIDATTVSQFENHLRAICDIPLAQPITNYEAMMVNIIGSWPRREKLFSTNGLAFHDYQKQEKPKRKIGHVTVTYADNIIDFLSDNELTNVLLSESHANL